jgi:hypothetical protein
MPALDEPPDFGAIKNELIVMDVVLYAPPGGVRGDATNYLGGIADVLKYKPQRFAVGHLGSLHSLRCKGTRSNR